MLSGPVLSSSPPSMPRRRCARGLPTRAPSPPATISWKSCWSWSALSPAWSVSISPTPWGSARWPPAWCSIGRGRLAPNIAASISMTSPAAMTTRPWSRRWSAALASSRSRTRCRTCSLSTAASASCAAPKRSWRASWSSSAANTRCWWALPRGSPVRRGWKRSSWGRATKSCICRRICPLCTLFSIFAMNPTVLLLPATGHGEPKPAPAARWRIFREWGRSGVRHCSNILVACRR